MKELELKFLEINRDDLVARLEVAGAVKIIDAVLKTVYFDFPDGRIFKNNELCRVRTFGEKIELCVKKNMRIEEGCKVYDEVETHVSDFDAICEILQGLGMISVIRFEKKRLEYLYGGVKFEIDEFPGVPVFLEMEAESNDVIQRMCVEFGLGAYEQTAMTGEELLKVKYGVSMNNLIF